MSTFVPGQRWVVDTEPELGLGIVVSVEGRRVNIYFQQGDCERCYAMQQAPLTRIKFSVDDTINLPAGGSAKVIEVHEQNGILIYDTDAGELVAETSLPSEIQLNQPFMRLMTGQLDKPLWFYFKRQLNQAMTKTWQSRLNGLLGVRANLIPHQIYVANTACDRENVRVLLADEVGLGKTIEAGMILSRLTRMERVNRSLIIVPDALQVQWLVELVRKFSLKPELFSHEDHDFHSGQIHIIPHSALAAQAEAVEAGEFDLVIADEAHHILPGSDEFECLKHLSEKSPHLVLLTATPEQLGVENHFARLQLLDPSKFTDLDAFKSQEADFVALNQRIQSLPEGKEALIRDYQLDVDAGEITDARLIDRLLDSHGVGRVMFRNVRSAISGFPTRAALPHHVEDDSWEAKFEWLAQHIKSNKDEKILVITHDIEQVFECEQYLWKKHGLDAAVFHEEQNLIDRDKAAAYFADMEQGSQILICSEIGSEGRNFQFSHMLVCLDLPEHPDLLEQRIGRLDRIGQQHDVQIHVPYAEGSHTETQFAWFNNILQCIETLSPAAGAVHDEYWPAHIADTSNNEITTTASTKLAQLNDDIQNGRDALIEMNSCRQPYANDLVSNIEAHEADSPLTLIELASELLQFHFEETIPNAYSLVPSDKMLVPALPGIPPEGAEVTFDRGLANLREDLLFLSWDAPFIQGLWDMLHHSEVGSASVATLPSRQLPAGHCLLECGFDIVVQAENSSICRPFFPSLTVRTLTLDVGEKDLAEILGDEALQTTIESVKKHLATEVIKSKKEEIPLWFKKSEVFAETKKLSLIDQALVDAKKFYQEEVSRIERLAKINALIDEHEVNTLKERAIQVAQSIEENVQLQLSSIRLIVVTEPK